MPHLVHTYVRTYIHTRARAHTHLPVYPRGLTGGCPPPRSADGVIASAQIEYISYVFITTAALRRPAICRPPPAGRPAARAPRRPTARRRLAMVAEAGRKVGRGKAEDAEPRSRMREKEARRKGERRAAVGIAAAARGREEEKGEAAGVRGGGHGKSSVRRYRLTDVRLSVVKR